MKINWQRIFFVKREVANLLLVKIQELSNENVHYQADYIFQTEEGYDIGVSETGVPAHYKRDELCEFLTRASTPRHLRTPIGPNVGEKISPEKAKEEIKKMHGGFNGW